MPSEVLFGVFQARDNPARPSLVYCGDKRTAKNLAARLIRIAQLAYEGKGGPEVAYRFERFGR